MPLYDYQCKKCNFIHEELRSMHERDKIAFCQKCKKKTSLTIISGHIAIHNKQCYTPQSEVEKLTGPNARGPGIKNKNRTTILSGCKHQH